MLTGKDDLTGIHRDHYFMKEGKPRNLRKKSSIRPALHAHERRICEGSLWLIGQNSEVKFWTDNWLGYSIAYKLGIPQHILDLLTCSAGDYLVDGVWYFTS